MTTSRAMPAGEQIVHEYLLTARAAVDTIVATIDGVYTLRDLVQSVMEGRILREGSRPGGWGYSVHGAGCSIETPSGAGVDIDVDLFGDGQEIFNAWRVVEFADSIESAPRYSLDDIRAACTRLHKGGLLRVHHNDWYLLR